jgi:transcriptional regulator with XRE-family HTH domain
MTDDGAARRQRLAQHRKALGLTQEALASLLDVAPSTVVRWVRGETQPLPQIRRRLAKKLRISAERLDDLLAGTGPAGPALAEVPHQLPGAVADFTGRAELHALTEMLDGADASGQGTVVISAIGGTADRLPASTAVQVVALVRPELLLEVEALALAE